MSEIEADDLGPVSGPHSIPLNELMVEIPSSLSDKELKKMLIPDIKLESFSVPEFTYCGECAYWKYIEGDKERCRKHAPRPDIENSFASTTQQVVWPATKKTEGCFEGDRKENCKEEDNCDSCAGACKAGLQNVNTKMSNCI